MFGTIEKDIIMTGYAAMGGISYILYNRENEIKEHLPGLIINNAKKYIKDNNVNIYDII